jgi:hypothetical protein
MIIQLQTILSRLAALPLIVKPYFMKCLLCICLFLTMTFELFAQKALTFSSQNYAGIIVGEANVKPQLQTINGISNGKWFAGIGTGIDWYYKRSIPLFASVNRNLFTKGKRQFFVAADAGINFPWRGANDMYTEYYFNDNQLKSGLYWNGGAGFKLGVGKADNALLFQIGYSFKQSGERTTTVSPCLVPPCPASVNAYDYRLKRVSVKLGWGF